MCKENIMLLDTIFQIDHNPEIEVESSRKTKNGTMIEA